MPKEPSPFPDRLEVSGKVQRLEVSEPPVEDTQPAPTRVLTEVVPLQEERPESATRRFEGQHAAVDATPGDDQIVSAGDDFRQLEAELLPLGLGLLVADAVAQLVAPFLEGVVLHEYVA